MDMSLVYYIAAFITLAAAGYKARGLRGATAAPTLRAFCVTLLALGLALLVLAPSSRPVLDGWLGVPLLARWLGNGLTLVAACAIQTVLAHFTRGAESPPPRTRLRVVILLLAVTAMGCLLLPARVDDEGAISYLAAGNPQVLAYLLIYLCYLGVAMADALLMAARYARHTPSRYLRLGMRLIAAGSAVGLVYVAHKIGLTVLRYIDVPTGKAEVASPALAITASLLLVIGSTIGTWGPGVQERIAAWRSLRRLRPLWEPLREAFPEIVLKSAGDVRTRQYRRVIEIGDGQLRLRPYQDPALPGRATALASAAGLTGHELRATVQAAVLAAALTAKKAGHPPHADAETIGAGTGPAIPADLDGEVAWLEQVAQAFASSPIVRQVAAEQQQADHPEHPELEGERDDHR